jgi:pyruvate dehydrogenase E2 component (dihydrolipoamide acetyltransferase)
MSMQSITLPELADGVIAATLVRWLKQPGEEYCAGDSVVELEIEDALVHLEASQSGRLLRVVAQPRQTVRVGAELAQVEAMAVGAEPAHVEATSPPAPEPKAETTVTGQPSQTPGPPASVVPILMPQAGNTMEEGMIVSWKVSEGDHIEVGQIICEIETDKATIEYESPEAGRLARIVAHEDDTVPVKQPIAFLADNDADVDAHLAAMGTTAAAAAGTSAGVPGGSSAREATVTAEARVGGGPPPVTAEGRIKASPAARKVARERGIDLASLGPGSGPGGRVLSTDVEKAKVAAIVSADGQPIRRPMPKMRRAIGLNLQRSKQTVPHFYVRMTIDAGPLFAYYREQKPRANCTLNDCVVLAVGRAMAECPGVRSRIDGDQILEYPHANIGIAVGVDDGLVVPVVRNVDTLTLAQLAAEARRVVDNAREGKLENLGLGNFTITNLGMFGVEEFSAIINPPESGILAVSAVRETVIVENGTMRPGRAMTMTLSADHRVVDGLLAAKFLGRLKEILENPSEALA